MRLDSLYDKIKEQMNSPLVERMKSVVLSLSRNQEGFSVDECEAILGDFERFIKAGVGKTWTVMSILLDYYQVNYLKETIWTYEETIGNEVPETYFVPMVDVDNYLLGEQVRLDCALYLIGWDGGIERFEEYYS